MRDFYIRQLKENILPFWMKRCLDEKYGGYFNCFDNRGENLLSRDKYTWSQGRFLWLFSTFALDKSQIFSRDEKKEFLSYAKSGFDFLSGHCLLGDGVCAFLLDETGKPKGEVLDASIYADCFVVLGFAAYYLVSKEARAKALAIDIYESIKRRLAEGSFKSLPYPLDKEYKAHGIPMIMSNTAMQMSLLDQRYLSDVERYTFEVQNRFTDESFTIRETISDKSGICDDGLLFTHINPGHTLEDVWFMLDAATALKSKTIEDKAVKIARRALEVGWDEEEGGLLHFCDKQGGIPRGRIIGTGTEKQVQERWDDKLWWIHSEALYTTLRCYKETGDDFFFTWHQRLKEYTFSHFPNPDKSIGEWIQILDRKGSPMEKVVALPVKDPFHIARDFYLITLL